MWASSDAATRPNRSVRRARRPRRVSAASEPVPIEEVGDDALLRPIDRGIEIAVAGIVLFRLAERGDRVLVIALRLQRLAEAAVGVGAGQLEVGPRATQFGGAAPVACAQHPRSFDLEYGNLG